MAVEPPLSVLFLWHQHQPLYKDGLTNRYEMPWVRLHATKDYYDMVALLDEFPTIKANFNLVPSLLTQLDDYAHGKAQDKFLALTVKSPADLSFEERQFILQNFFMAHWEHMVDPHIRYRELLDKRGRMLNPENLARAQTYYKEQDWRDLQVWFNLTWFDPLWRERDALIKGLFEKGKNFTEEEKQKLVSKQQEVCGLVVAKHKELQDRGQIEITTTPFYHPILPLLCDTETARAALPQITLPTHRFLHPEDAREQLRRAYDDYTQRFGRAPQGLWPSEGSVSEEAARLIVETGIRWAATDEGVLARSVTSGTLTREDLYEPYRLMFGDKPLHFFFRDHELSDAIGFVYATWEPEQAAKDFVQKLRNIRASFKDKTRPHVVSVILDGENCWEYYRQDGLPFLRALYSQLAAEPTLETVRGSDYLDRNNETRTLPGLWSGSWINSNFKIWIGHTEDNAAWDFLLRTRQFLVNLLEAHPEKKNTEQSRTAWEEIYIAEGSDWCWWYGDEHSSAYDSTFDYLFRKHLMNVYTLMGEKVPDDLHIPIKKKRVQAKVLEPVDFIDPKIDGRVTNYFEWLPAGVYYTEAGATGTMHKAENYLKALYYGFDLEKIYLRCDFNRPLTAELLKRMTLQIAVQKPVKQTMNIAFGANNELISELKRCGAYQKIAEIELPIISLTGDTKQEIELSVIVLKDGLEQERWPSESTLHIPYPDQNTFVDLWHV